MLPPTLVLNNIQATVAKEFKLLGVTIDNKLTFSKHVSNVLLLINKKLYSINRLYLSTSVKIQFFKTFILPYFDYCLSLIIYFSKPILQKICNFYFTCLHKLFKFDFFGNDFNTVNNFL